MSLNIQVNRKVYSPDCIIGEMTIDGQFFCHTLEPAWRDLGADGSGKVIGKTAIPAGTYDIVVDYSNHFGRELPHILNVPFFAGVRCHGGNTAADTEGCTICGQETDGKELVRDCKGVVDELTAKIKANPGSKYTVSDGEECPKQVA